MPIEIVTKKRRRKKTLSESELQAKYKNSQNKTIQAMLAARREHLQRNDRFLTAEEINEDLKR